MPVRGVNEVRSRLRRTMQNIGGPLSQRTITEALVIGMGYAALITPVDTSNLINSAYREVKNSGDGWYGRGGYTAAYAAAVHGLSGRLDGEPRANFGASGFGGGTGVGNYWDPRAEPEFLLKGFERDGVDDIRAAIIRGMRV